MPQYGCFLIFLQIYLATVLVLIALLVDTESCGAESPQGYLNLCFEIDATGPTELLEDDPALITIHLTASRWSALRSGYRNGQF